MGKIKVIYIISVILSIIGIMLSVYLLDESRVLSSSFCEISGRISCSSVIQSKYSKFLGLPMAFYGLLWFITSGILAFLSLKIQKARLGLFMWGIIGLVGVFVLNYIELILINAFCLYCGFAHVIAASIFGLSLLGWREGIY